MLLDLDKRLCNWKNLVLRKENLSGLIAAIKTCRKFVIKINEAKIYDWD
jgi:hypothetical protein